MGIFNQFLNTYYTMKFGIRWWRNHDASFLHFDTILACDGRTDRRTDTLRSLLPAL